MKPLNLIRICCLLVFLLPVGCSNTVSQEDAKQQVLEADIREELEYGTDEDQDAEDEAEERASRRGGS